MRRGYRLLLLVSITSIQAFVLEDDHCNYLYSNNCLTKPSSVLRDMNLCEKEEAAKDVNFVLMTDETRIPPAMLKVEFPPPRQKCKYGVTLLANETIKSESECANYTFSNSNRIEAETHTGQIAVCNVPEWKSEYALEGGEQAELTSRLCQANVSLRYQHIFTGCYAILFHLAENRNEVRGNVFLPTSYKRTEVSEPSFGCRYGVAPNIKSESKRKTLFVTDISAPADTEISLRLLLDSKASESADVECQVNAQAILYNWTVNVEQNSSDNRNCSINVVRAKDGKPVRTAECRFVVDVPEPEKSRDYCFLISLNDERCKRRTLWNPPMPNNIPCTWTKRCDKIQEDDSEDISATEIQTQTWMDANAYLLLPAVIIVTIMFTMFGMIYLVHYWRTRNERVAFHIHGKVRRADGEIAKKMEEKQKEEEYDVDLSNRDIVLLYAKNNESFMALMAEFRDILGRICHCSVHDWYDGSVWNHVAKIGGPEWFAEMLESGCRVIWMDTPTIRSLVTAPRRFRNGGLPGREGSHDYIEIGDFRDVLFPTVFKLAKRNAQRSTSRCPIHFIVRLRGFDNFAKEEGEDEEEEGEEVADPFTELSPYTRYLMPQDLSQLCSHLNAASFHTSPEDTRLEEDFIRQHLIHVEFESYK